MRLFLALAAACAALVFAGCGTDNSGSNGCAAGKPIDCTCAGGERGLAACTDGVLGVCECEGDGGGPVVHLWVTDSIEFPADDSVGVDVDGDGTIDNSLARSLGVFLAVGAISFDEYVTSGQLIQLHRLSAASPNGSAAATWEIFVGEPIADPDFEGEGSFTVASPLTVFEGKITGGRFEGSASALLLNLPIFGGQAPLPLARTRIESVVSATGCDGAVGGAISEALFATGVSLAINAAIQAEGCGPEVPCSETVSAMLDLFDQNEDHEITPQELTGNMIWSLAFSPDIDTDGDKVPDAISVGWGFTCVGAKFEPPA